MNEIKVSIEVDGEKTYALRIFRPAGKNTLYELSWSGIGMQSGVHIPFDRSRMFMILSAVFADIDDAANS